MVARPAPFVGVCESCGREFVHLPVSLIDPYPPLGASDRLRACRGEVRPYGQARPLGSGFVAIKQFETHDDGAPSRLMDGIVERIEA